MACAPQGAWEAYHSVLKPWVMRVFTARDRTLTISEKPQHNKVTVVMTLVSVVALCFSACRPWPAKQRPSLCASQVMAVTALLIGHLYPTAQGDGTPLDEGIPSWPHAATKEELAEKVLQFLREPAAGRWQLGPDHCRHRLDWCWRLLLHKPLIACLSWRPAGDAAVATTGQQG